MNEGEIKQKLTPEQYNILREKGTEVPFSGKYVHEKTRGKYSCFVCGSPLFSSDAKFDSGTGWPSFDRAIPGAVKYTRDNSFGMSRTEITCAKCNSHLGHVFSDGPTQTGKRYCINSVCLNLEKEGSGAQESGAQESGVQKSGETEGNTAGSGGAPAKKEFAL